MKKTLIKHIRRFLIGLALALFIEVFILNYTALRTIVTGNYIESVPFEIKTNEDFANEEIKITDIGKRVTSINIELGEATGDCIIYDLVFMTYDDSLERDLNYKIMSIDDKQYINFDTWTECKYISLKIQTNMPNEEPPVIKNISLNSPNFNISILRIIILWGIMTLTIYLKKGDIYNIKYNKDSKKQKYLFIAFLAILSFGLCSYISMYYDHQEDEIIVTPDKIENTDAIFLQTEAFANKSIKILIDVSEDVLNMEDPYNLGEKIDKSISFLFDVAYYDGAYYSYFGIAPILILILPFRLITGYYLQSYIFNFVFIIASIYLLYSVYKKMIEKYVKDISLFHFYAGYILMLSASNFINLLTGRKYEIPVTCGIMFILLSINLAMSINEWKKFKITKLIILRIVYWFNCFIKTNLYNVVSFDFIFNFN